MDLPPNSIVKPDGSVYDEHGRLIGRLEYEYEIENNNLSLPPPPKYESDDNININNNIDNNNNNMIAIKMIHNIPVVDGTLYGLDENTYIGPDGKVYSLNGEILGIMEGYEEAFGADHPKAIITPPPHPMVKGDPELIQEEVECEQDAFLENNTVLVHGHAIGTVNDDGIIVNIHGEAQAQVTEQSLLQVEENKKEVKKLSEQEQIQQLLFVPDYHHSNIEDKKNNNNISLKDKQSNINDDIDDYEPIEIKEEKGLLIKDPKSGRFLQGFKREFFEKRSKTLKHCKIIPSRFTRTYLQADFYDEYKCLDIPMFQQIISNRLSGNNLKLLWLSKLDNILTKTEMKKLSTLLSKYTPSLEVLGLRSSGITSLDNLKLPKLLRLDLRYNKITTVDHVSKTIKYLSKLQIIDILHNDIMIKGWDIQKALPFPKNKIWKSLLTLPDLDMINNQLIPNELRRSAALNFKQLNTDTSLILFQHSLNFYANNIINMIRWEPNKLTSLHLSNQGLCEVHLGSFPMLKDINLSHNYIESIRNSGIHHCTQLITLDLSYNQLNEKDLHIFGLLFSLRSLNIYHNPKLDKKGQDYYKRKLLAHTRYLKGDNRTTGLIELNGELITVEQRVQAVVAEVSPKTEDWERWHLNLIKLYGHYQLEEIDNFAKRIRIMNLSNCNLAVTYLNDFINLESLNLSGNRLSIVQGLEYCKKLRILDLSCNASLKLKKLFNQLILNDEPITTLEHISLAENPKKVDKKYIMRILTVFSPTNTKLCVIDGRLITFKDRVQVFECLSKNKEGGAVDVYRVNLALCMAATQPNGRNYSYDALLNDASNGRAQYDVTKIETLMTLNNCQLSSEYLNVNNFISLKRLNIANNELDNLLNIGLQKLRKLEWLDARNNRIRNSLDDLGKLIDGFNHLQVIALRGNPCMRNKRHRVQLIAKIDSLRTVDCPLRVIDTPLSVDERVKAMMKFGMTTEESEKLRFGMALFLRAPERKIISYENLRQLNLDNSNLTIFDMKNFVSLEVLRLRNNKRTTLAGSHIENLKELRVLDLRDNQLNSLEEIVHVTNKLKNLEYLGANGNPFVKNDPIKYRQRIIGSIRQLRYVGCPLIFLDEKRIDVDEIVAGWLTMGAKPNQVALFRFDRAVHEHLPKGKKPAQLKKFDLSSSKLTAVDFKPFLNIEHFNLSSNSLTGIRLKKGGLKLLKKLIHLNLENNSFNTEDDLKYICEVINQMPTFRSLNIKNNKICPDNSNKSRIKFLSHIHGIDEQMLNITHLNNQEITVNERIDALEYRERQNIDIEELERVRLVLNLENINADIDQISMNLSHRQLVYLSALTQFQKLTVLNLSNNNITTIKNQGLEQLQRLQKLDLSYNKLTSLDETINALTKCHRLEILNLDHATLNNDCNTMDQDFIDKVTFYLKGLRQLNGKFLEPLLNDDQADAQQYLWEVAGIGKNTLVNIDIANMKIPGEFYFYILSALKEVGCVQTVRLQGNGWHIVLSGEKETVVKNYRSYAIHTLGEQLIEVDTDPIFPEERLAAIQQVRQDIEKFGVNLVQPWKEIKNKAYNKMRERKKDDEEKKRYGQDVDFIDLAVPGGAASAESGNAAAGGDGVITDAFGGVIALGGAAVVATGSFLNKLEIMINWLQIYGLVLVIDVNIPWPSTFVDFSVHVPAFTLDIDAYFDLVVDYQQQLKFTAVMSLPMMFYLGYIGFAAIDKQKWIDRYITNWQKTRKRAWYKYLFALLFICIISAVLDNFQFTTRFTGYLGLGSSIITIFGIIWYLVIRTFRKHRLRDKSTNHEAFFRWWLKRIFFLRRMCLFCITIFFMPVARVILSQFQCYCPSDSHLNDFIPEDTSDPGNLQCHIRPFPNQECLFNEISVLQVIATIFAIAYIVGIPILFFFLIKRGVHQMVDIHGFSDERERVKQRVTKLREKYLETRESKFKKQIKSLQKELETFYHSKAATNKLPQTYLYIAYRRKYRYFKLVNFFEKLLIIIATLFFLGTFKLVMANIVVGIFTIISWFSRPFNNTFEVFMEIVARNANTVNIFVALALHNNYLSSQNSEFLLLCFNGMAVFVFAIAILATPFLWIKDLMHQ